MLLRCKHWRTSAVVEDKTIYEPPLLKNSTQTPPSRPPSLYQSTAKAFLPNYFENSRRFFLSHAAAVLDLRSPEVDSCGTE
ncbi:hypothetical protein L6452_23563 [Arctium lappa]|uniref:Uncharacterized protein n=1 Tax=Arctium lappa TaxID=4217 RepID=A0ACB9B3Z3_ARCLA|nr:hypothetical protein L6452_23563 [Arctium lappa]